MVAVIGTQGLIIMVEEHLYKDVEEDLVEIHRLIKKVVEG
jgi:hypothetical protein